MSSREQLTVVEHNGVRLVGAVLQRAHDLDEVLLLDLALPEEREVFEQLAERVVVCEGPTLGRLLQKLHHALQRKDM